MRTNNTTSVTFHLDDDVSLKLKKVEMDLRKKGYKRMSRTFLLNAFGDFIANTYEKDGFKQLEGIIKTYWTKWNGEEGERI